MIVIGKNHVTAEQLLNVVTPPETESFKPLPHHILVEYTREALNDAGFQIVEEDHVVAKDGLRYFGGFALSHTSLSGDRRQIVCGVRNANDKSFPAAICIGNRMMVCENLCFSSEEKLTRRHTKNIMRDLRGVIVCAITRLIKAWNDMETRIKAYENVTLDEQQAAHLLLGLIDNSGLPARDFYNTILCWRNPENAATDIVERNTFIIEQEDGFGFDEEGYQQALAAKQAELIAEFGGDTLWGLYNAVTHVLKGSCLDKLPQRTMNMQALFDGFAGVVVSVGEAINTAGLDENDQETDEARGEFIETFGEVVEDVVEDSDSNIDTIAMLIER
jgi:hypothetical protein